MKKSLKKSLCRGTDSVATINSNNFRVKLSFSPFLGHRKHRPAEASVEDFSATTPSLISSYNMLSDDDLSTPPTLEEMLARLDDEEEEETAAAAAQLAELMALSNLGSSINLRRMSSVNNSDLMRAAKNALNGEYARFSVDGRDVEKTGDLAAKKFHAQSKHHICLQGHTTTINKENEFCERFRKPCLVERLMGLETMPVHTPSPSGKNNSSNTSKNSFVSRAIDERRFMAQQPKPINLERQKHQRPPLPLPLPRDVKHTRNAFGSYQKSATKHPLGIVQVPSCSLSKKLQASSSKAQEPLMMKKKPKNNTSMEEEKKSSNSRSGSINFIEGHHSKACNI